MTTLPTLCTLWVGPTLGVIERACLLSAMRQGHRVTLYCYERPSNVPFGIHVADASEILPENRMIRHKSGSISLSSNHFRYELLKQGRGIWIDADVYLVRPIPNADYVFGWEGDSTICGAVLRLPPTAPILARLTQIFERRLPPPWLSWRARVSAWLRLVFLGNARLADMPWGTAGPAALTALTRTFALQDHAVARSVFYPVPWQDAGWIFDPARRLEDVIGPDTLAVHLWNEVIKDRKHGPAPPGSFFARLHGEAA